MIIKANFDYSLKNIPIPSPKTHLKGVIANTETFLQNARWKCFHYLLPPKTNKKKTIPDTFGFKYPKSAPLVNELVPFEKDLNHLISTFEYSDHKTKFQKQLLKDVQTINKSPNIFVFADKTSNIYEVDPPTYKKLVSNNVHRSYKKANDDTVHNINKEAKRLTEQLKLSDRIEKISEKEAYITIKDHKPNFPDDIKCRLINPCKSNIGKITKQLFDRINSNIITKLDLAQLKNTASAIEWFKLIPDKKQKNLIQIDIVDYYPSVNEKLFKTTIEFAEKITPISNLEKELLYNARQSVLYHDNAVWTKTTGLFDVTMGSFDGAQITDLVGLMILAKFKDEFPDINLALYRDDGLGFHNTMTPQKLDNIRKKLHSFFKKMDLQITIETGLKKVDFLDVTFDLNDASYQPYRKPNDTPLYIHKQSNHPKHVIFNNPIAINKRLSEISSSKQKFDRYKNIYQDALNASEYNFKLNYIKDNYNSNISANSNENSTNDNTDHQTLPKVLITNTPDLASNSRLSASPVQSQLVTPTQPRRSQRLRNNVKHSTTNQNKPTTTSMTDPVNLTQPHVMPTPPNTDQNSNDKLHDDKKTRNKNKKKILWFNPPFSSSLKTKFGQLFLKLLDKHFPIDHPLYPVMNRRKCKISFRTCPSMKNIIDSHNKRIMKKLNAKKVTLPCNCRKDCPIQDGKCRTESVIYCAEIKDASYIGLTSGQIKDRITSHRQTFREKDKQNSTTLSKFIWTNNLNKDDTGNIIEPSIKWTILQQCDTYKPGQKHCNLCLTEKLFIISNINKPNNINKRTDIATTCIHKQKHYLNAIT